jgi:hypothetical protein
MIAASTSENRARQNSAHMYAAVDRIAVALVRKAAADLQATQDRTGLSKTELINRAISLYEFIDTEMRDGGQVLIQDSNTGETRVLRLL